MLIWAIDLKSLGGKRGRPVRYQALIEVRDTYVDADLICIDGDAILMRRDQFPFVDDSFSRSQAIVKAFTTAEEWHKGAENARADIEETLAQGDEH